MWLKFGMAPFIPIPQIERKTTGLSIELFILIPSKGPYLSFSSCSEEKKSFQEDETDER
jgi:hypothetical protein